jgi:hypothetical protein
VRYPYGYDSGEFDDPATHTYGPNGQTAWLLKHQQTYRFAYDNGDVLDAGVPCGDISKQSADAVTVPLFRQTGQLFGMVSMQSYAPDSYDDNAVRAFEWLAEMVARVLAREDEDRKALRRRWMSTKVRSDASPVSPARSRASRYYWSRVMTTTSSPPSSGSV